MVGSVFIIKRSHSFYLVATDIIALNNRLSFIGQKRDNDKRKKTASKERARILTENKPGDSYSFLNCTIQGGQSTEPRSDRFEKIT